MQAIEPAVPTLLYLLCAMSAMAFLLSAYLWLWRAAYGENKLDFKPSIYKGQFYSLLSVLVLSIVLGLYDYVFYERNLQIVGEVFVLLSALIYAFVKARKRGGTSSALSPAIAALSFGAFCVLGWGITISLGLLFSYIFNILGLSPIGGIDPNVVFIVGLLWIAPIIVLYVKITQNPDKKSVLDGNGFHKFLWPVLLAYIILLFPLLMQQISVSEKWRDMKNEKPFKII